MDFLEEIAKFRAARRMWARIMKERFGATNPRAMMLRFHTQTAGCTLTAQQPDNNVVRVAYQALSAVLGGTQSLHTNSRDEAFALPSQASVQIALRTQQLIAYETGSADTVDPLAGSYFIEALTSDIEKRAFDYIRKIDEMGGAVKAVECGYIEEEILDSAYSFQKAVESGDQVIVGVNKFQTEAVPPKDLLRVDPKVRENQIRRLAELKSARDSDVVRKTLQDLENAARGSENLMNPILDAVRGRVTLGEICGVLRQVFGEHIQASHC